VDGVRQSPDSARVVQDPLRAIPGVVQVTTDPRTGSVLLLYDPHCPIGRDDGGVLEHPENTRAGDGAGTAPRARATLWATWLVRTAVVVTLEVVLQRALGPFFSRRC
jgi:hypothetical protein